MNFVFVRTKQRQQVEQNCDDASKGKKSTFIPYFTLGTTEFVLTSIIIRYTTNLNYKKKKLGLEQTQLAIHMTINPSTMQQKLVDIQFPQQHYPHEI